LAERKANSIEFVTHDIPAAVVWKANARPKKTDWWVCSHQSVKSASQLYERSTVSKSFQINHFLRLLSYVSFVNRNIVSAEAKPILNVDKYCQP
jgi:hypothetical protein